MNNPYKTIGLGFAFVILIGLGSVAPRAFNDIYSKVFPPALQNPFQDEKIIHSNFIPLENDIIDLGLAGTLIPSPYNLTFSLDSEGVCVSTETPSVDYSKGIVLILNIAPTLTSRSEGRGISFRPPPASDYFTFEGGTTHEIKTNGRTFLVTLSHINDLSTEENGPYFSYPFKISEK